MLSSSLETTSCLDATGPDFLSFLFSWIKALTFSDSLSEVVLRVFCNSLVKVFKLAKYIKDS